MRLKSVFTLLAAWAFGFGPPVIPVHAYDTVGNTGCVAPACVLANTALRFGTGAENSVNAYGLFQQPWYYSTAASTWYKLTYDNYPLDTAIGFGIGGSHWSGTTSIFNLYTLTPTSPATDYSEFVATAVDATKTTGYGKVMANRTYTLGGNSVILQNTFSLGRNDSFVKVVIRLINTSPNAISNVILWTGTRDDFVGITDINTKTRGNLGLNGFTALTAIGQTSNAIMITNTDEGVLFYSDSPGVITAYARCCMFSDVYNTNPQTLGIATPNPTDGSYAAILPLGTVQRGDTGEIVWYYGAGAIALLNNVSQTVAEAHAAETSPSVTASASVTVSPTASVSESASVTGSPTLSVTPTLNATGTPLRMVTDWPSSTGTPDSTPTHTATFFSTHYPSFQQTRTGTATPLYYAVPYPSVSPTPVDAATLQKLTEAQKSGEERATTVGVAVGGAAVGAIAMTAVAIAAQKLKAQIDARRLLRRGPRAVGGLPLPLQGRGRNEAPGMGRNEEGIGYLELNEEDMARALDMLVQAGIHAIPVAQPA